MYWRPRKQLGWTTPLTTLQKRIQVTSIRPGPCRSWPKARPPTTRGTWPTRSRWPTRSTCRSIPIRSGTRSRASSSTRRLPPARRCAPPRSRTPASAPWLGALLGVIITVAMGRSDRKLRERDEIAGAIGVPVLASIPGRASVRYGRVDQAAAGVRARGRARVEPAQGAQVHRRQRRQVQRRARRLGHRGFAVLRPPCAGGRPAARRVRRLTRHPDRAVRRHPAGPARGRDALSRVHHGRGRPHRRAGRTAVRGR